jgi:hypothetical protein
MNNNFGQLAHLYEEEISEQGNNIATEQNKPNYPSYNSNLMNMKPLYHREKGEVCVFCICQRDNWLNGAKPMCTRDGVFV